MLTGLQVGFGACVGAEVLEDLRRRGCEMVRVQVNLSDEAFTRVSPETAAAIAQEALDAEIMPLVIIREADQIQELPPGVHVEVGNEPDLAHFGWTLDRYRREFLRAIPIAEAHGVHLWGGVVSNLNRRGLAFLRGLPWADIPSWVGCSVHRYPDGAPERGHTRDVFGARYTRDGEIAELRRIVGARPLGVSELGYNCRDYREDDGAAHLAWERAFFARHQFTFAIAYQLNSGEPDDPHHDAHFGFRRHDGSWRPCAETWFLAG